MRLRRGSCWLCSMAAALVAIFLVCAAELSIGGAVSKSFVSPAGPHKTVLAAVQMRPYAQTQTSWTATGQSTWRLSLVPAMASVALVGIAMRKQFSLHSVYPQGRGQSRVSLCSSASDVGVILLSAGVGKRMGANIPKQYIKLLGLEIVLHSLDTFLKCDVAEIAIVCSEEWQHVFKDHLAKKGDIRTEIKFTVGGNERQDSVCNGLAEISTELVAVHDGARPLVTCEEVEKVIADARNYGAALLAVQTKATIKQASEGADGEPVVATTPNRKIMWEAHTPQVIRAELLRKGFANAAEKSLEVTDDVSLVESLGEPVKLTEGEYTNIKVTTPEDIAVAETILKERGFVAPASE